MLYTCMLLHQLAQLAWSTGTWTSEAIFLATASQCEACSCTLAMDDLQQILWGWVLLCHHRQQNVLCVRKAPSPISGIHSFIIPHPCHDLEVGPERMVFHSTWRVGGSFSGLTNAFEEITFLVSTSLRRECRDWPSLPPTSATMAFWPTSSMFSILWFCLQNSTAQSTRTGSLLINFWIKGFFPIPAYARRGITPCKGMCK